MDSLSLLSFNSLNANVMNAKKIVVITRVADRIIKKVESESGRNILN